MPGCTAHCSDTKGLRPLVLTHNWWYMRGIFVEYFATHKYLFRHTLHALIVILFKCLYNFEYLLSTTLRTIIFKWDFPILADLSLLFISAAGHFPWRRSMEAARFVIGQSEGVACTCRVALRSHTPTHTRTHTYTVRGLYIRRVHRLSATSVFINRTDSSAQTERQLTSIGPSMLLRSSSSKWG